MPCKKLVFLGTVASPVSLNELTVSCGYLVVENGIITGRGTEEQFISLEKSGAFSKFEVIRLSDSQFLLPGFVDCHLHAPQFPNIGLGLDRPLLEWLDKYTFPLEDRYKDTEFAKSVYDQVVKRLLNNGTTSACYFGSLHIEGTLQLAKSVIKNKQRALVGKVSMNIKNNAEYYNETEKELNDVETFVKNVYMYQSDLVRPIITPRFALSCDRALMEGLSRIAKQYKCNIQSHISENKQEIEAVLKMNPGCKSYADVYDKSGIFDSKCIMAHAIHLTEDEMGLFAAKGVSVAHCPASNTRLKSGLCPVRKLLNNNIVVGLGTDVSGGDSATILDAMRRTMDVSTHLELQGQERSIDWKEALYLATLGGAKALNLDDKIGNFEVGKELDALLIDVYSPGGPIDKYQFSVTTKEEQAISLVQRFVYLGDDRNIICVYVKGEKVKS